MLPRKFATNVGLRMTVCKAADTGLGGDAVKAGPELREALVEASMLLRRLLSMSLTEMFVRRSLAGVFQQLG